MSTTVLYYDTTATRIVRERSYPSAEHAMRAMARAAKRGQIAAIKATRKASDAPTVHH